MSRKFIENASAFMLKSADSYSEDRLQNSVLHVQYTEIYLESFYFNAQQRLNEISLV